MANDIKDVEVHMIDINSKVYQKPSYTKQFIISSILGIFKPIRLINARIGYDCTTKAGKYEWLFSTMLFLILVTIAVIFSSVIIPIDLDAKLCDSKDAKLMQMKEYIHNISNIEALMYNFTLLNNTANYHYEQAALYHSDWPNPYIMNDTEYKKLESLANKQCSEEVCKYDGWIFGLDCVTITVPCPDANAANRFKNYNDYRRAMNFTVNSTIDNNYQYNFALDTTVSEILQLLLDRIRIASSLYTCYRALMIFFSSRNLVGESLKTRMCNFNINKLLWIVCIVILLYLIDFILNGVGFIKYFKIGWYEPCWIDMEYTSSIFNYMNDIGQNITFMRYDFQATGISFERYKIIDKSYLSDVYPSNVLRYPAEIPSITFTTNFSSAATIEYLMNGAGHEGRHNGNPYNVFKFSIFIILIQPILCEYIISLWNIIYPLSIYCGRIIYPENFVIKDIAAVRASERIHSICVNAIYSVIIIWILWAFLA